MDKNTVLAVVVVGVCFVAMLCLFLLRKRFHFILRILGLSAEIKGEGDSAQDRPGVHLEGAKTSDGQIDVKDKTGKGAHVKGVSAKGDIKVSSEEVGEGPAPKS